MDSNTPTIENEIGYLRNMALDLNTISRVLLDLCDRLCVRIKDQDYEHRNDESRREYKDGQ